MKAVKSIAATLVLFAALSSPAFAGHGHKKMKMKEHVCTAACKDGKHMYAHGEKGHVCTDTCKKAMKEDKEMKKM